MKIFLSSEVSAAWSAALTPSCNKSARKHQEEYITP
jgi:hypothetical protein